MEDQKRIRTSSAAAANSEFTINYLDNESLGIIFNKLPYCDRVGIESVCKRWRDVSKVNWCFYFKHLAIGEGLTFPPLHDNAPEKNKSILENILERRGHYVKKITFVSDINVQQSFKVGTIKQIVKRCPNLKHLTTDYVPMNAEDWLACNNLQALSFNNRFKKCEEVRELFRRNKRLRQLKMSFTNCWANTFDHLDHGQLEILHIIMCPNFELTDRVADKLAESLVDLKYVLHPFGIYNLQPLRKLKNLRSLFLYIALVELETVQFIGDMAENCQKLEHIYLYIYVTDDYNIPNFIPALLNLPCLKHLVIILNKYEIPYEELVRLFRKAPNLKFFLLSSCARCTYEENNVKFCDRHSQSRVENLDSVASNSNKAVIITANTAVIIKRERRSRGSYSDVLGESVTNCLCDLISTK